MFSPCALQWLTLELRGALQGVRLSERLGGTGEQPPQPWSTAMEMINRAIEDASDFRGMMRKIERNTDALRMELEQLQRGELPDQEADGRRYQVVNDRQPGENRAAHRARLKRERREAKASKVPA